MFSVDIVTFICVSVSAPDVSSTAFLYQPFSGASGSSVISGGSRDLSTFIAFTHACLIFPVFCCCSYLVPAWAVLFYVEFYWVF